MPHVFNIIRFDGSVCPTYFSINSSGYILVKNESLLDREAITDLNNNKLRCIVQYFNSTDLLENVDIEILDLNDQVPGFLGFTQPFRINLTESITTGSLITTFRPTDNDNGLNGTTRINITAGNEGGYFELRVPATSTEITEIRDLFIVEDLNYNDIPGGMFNLSVEIRDMGNPSNSFVQTVLIFISNEQDEAPEFVLSTYTLNVREDHMLGPDHIFGSVTATGSLNIKYKIKNDNSYVGIVSQTGDLYLKIAVLPRTITLSVTAINTLTQEDTTVVVMVIITEVINEVVHFRCALNPITRRLCPQNELNGTTFTVPEDIASRSLVLLEAETEASLLHVNLALDPPDAPLILRGSFPIYTIFNNGSLDREQSQSITVKLRNADNHAQVYLMIRFLVTDVNDNPPVFASHSYSTVAFEGSPVGRQLGQVEATDADVGESGSVSYSIAAVDKEVASSWFTIAPDTGIIRINSTAADYAVVEGSVTLNVTATDNGTEPLSSSVSVTISTVLATSFSLNSYLEFFFSQAVNLLDKTSQDVYLEVLPQEDSGMLLYQQDLSGNIFSVSYQGEVVLVQLGGVVKNQTVDVARDWVGIHLQMTHQQVRHHLAVDCICYK